MFGNTSSLTFGGFGQASNNTQSTTGPANSFGSFGTQAAAPGAAPIFGQAQSNTPTFSGFGVSNQSTPFGGFGSSSQPQQSPSGFGFGQSTNTPTFGTTPSSLFASTNNTASAPTFGSQASSNLFSNGTTSGSNFGANMFSSQPSTQLANGTANPPFSVYSEKEGTGTGTNHFQSITCMPAYNAASFEELRLQDYNQNRRYGTAAPTAFTTPFGGTSQGSAIFGQSQASPFNQQSSGSLFGQNQAPSNNVNFGSQPANNTSIFGQPTQNSGLFGAVASSGGTNLFNNNSAPSNTTFGNPSSGSNLFGQTNTTTPFGQSSSNTTNNTSTPFGTNNAATKPFTFGTGSNTFGQASTPQTNNLFGNANNSTPTSTTNAFNQPSSTGGNTIFGQNNNATPNAAFSFGANTSSTPATTSNTFSFGSGTAIQANNPAPKPFSFGASPSTSTNSFGTTDANGPKPFSFGALTTTSAAPQNTGPFNQGTSSLNTTGSLFGQPQNALFNNSNNNASNTTNNTNSLFSKAPQATTSLFGTPSNGSTGLFGTPNNNSNMSIFGGNSTNGLSATFQPQQTTNSQGSLAGSAYGNNPLFSNLQSPAQQSLNPIARPLRNTSVKKKPASLPQFKLAPRSPAMSPNLQARSALLSSPHSSSHRSSLNLFDEELALRPDAFSPRTNLKHLIIERQNGNTHDAPPAFDNPKEESTTSTIDSPQGHSNNTLKSKEHDGKELQKTFDQDAEYWCEPSIQDLSKLSKVELRAVNNFRIGRHGYGHIRFLKPVDLSGMERLEDLQGVVINFGNKVCTVYPDEATKPSVGHGVNVSALVTLERCYPLSRDKRLPITEPSHPRVQQHTDRLQRMEGTEFQEYIPESGTWVFKVEHF